MKKSIWSSATRWVSLSVLLSVGLLGAVTSVADEASVKKAIEAAYPKIKVDSVTKTNYAGLYEIFMGGQIIYTDEKFSFAPLK